MLQVVMSYCQTEQGNRFEGIFAVNTHEGSSVVKSYVETVETASNTLTSCKIYCPWAYFHMTMIIFKLFNILFLPQVSSLPFLSSLFRMWFRLSLVSCTVTEF